MLQANFIGLNNFIGIIKVFSKFYQTSNFFERIFFKLKTLLIIIVKQTLKARLVIILRNVYSHFNI